MMFPKHWLLIFTICLAKRKQISILRKPTFGDDCNFTIGKFELHFLAHDQLSQFLKRNFKLSKANFCMNIEPIDILFHLYFNDCLANKIFFIPAFRLTYFKAKV